jgi:hypothetical protein
MSSPKSVAFFGATGGSTAPCLASCIKAGYTCTARSCPLAILENHVPANRSIQIVVRNASKLTELLETSQSVSSDLISRHLTIIVGNVKDSASVTQTLFPANLNPSNPTDGNKSVDLIVSGIGCYPVWRRWYSFPEQEDPTLCQDAISTILNALNSRPPLVKPGLVVVSGTGISKYGRDIPLLMVPLYSFLHTAHQDKKVMENLVIKAVTEDPAPIGSFAVVRPSLLTAGPALGMNKIRWDVEDGKVAEKAIGYTISRADVGGFVFEKVVGPFESGKNERTGKVYSITY